MHSSYTPHYPSKIKQPDYEMTHKDWDKLPDESDRAFEAFLIYRNMEIGRTTQKVAERIYGNNWESNLRFVDEWRKLFHWDRRSLAYDAFILDNETAIVEKSVRKARLMIADKLEELTDVALQGALGRKKVTREQAGLIMSFYDRVGPTKQQPKQETNILNQIQVSAPELPSAILQDFKAETSEYETMDEILDSLIPDDLRAKRGGGS